MTKHTTGPWELFYQKGYKQFNVFPVEHKGAQIAVCSIYSCFERPKAEDEANARLIAAAPEMLEALIACDEAMEYMSEYCIPINLPEKVKAAIKKARGE